eukprot:CAMPEP_0204831220 /NCGR_PEP_ID=MMETSP1346-20131115/10129_1 /ASSEMBLY_ACC=CAM_ASM_000771 /TAXON_ID=215587 /ORGANISM="Aplanochytrium stocchinoi, Strain GSBS06" /LENGTH=298 /DNA_ID=CAMNT_0051962063 /DNA_START=161 /DNA_END=1057 /DNA_ORIENTATION=+
MALGVGIPQHNEQDQALSLFHARGMIVHLTATETLKSMIIINPQWLINAFGKIIRDRSLHRLDAGEFQHVGLDNDLILAFQKGVASRDLLDYLWSDEPVEFLIDLMKRTMLLSDWGYSNEPSYLIPSLLESGFDVDTVTDTGYKFIFDFSENFLPIGVFLRLVCLCVAHAVRSQENIHGLAEPVLFKNFLSIELESGFILYLREDARCQSIIVTLENEKHAALGLKIVQSMLVKLDADVMGSGLSWVTLLQNETNGGFIAEYDARQQNLAPWYTEEKHGSQKIQSQNINLDAFFDSLS